MNNKNILLVEDEAIVGMAEKQELEKYGYNVTHITSGEESIHLVLKGDTSFDIILMDIGLGKGIDGTEAAEKILKAKEIPILFLSSHSEPELVEKTEKITSYGYVLKGTSIVVLDASIKMALRLFKEKMDRRQAEEELQRERAQLLSIFNSIDQAIYISDPKTYEVLYVNSFLAKLLKENPIGKKCYKVFHGLEAPCPFCTNDIIMKQKPDPYHWEFYNSNLGRYYQIVDRIIRWPDGRDVRFEIAIDITERKKAEETLRESEKKYRDLINSMNDTVWVIDYDTSILDVNNAATRVLGYTREELLSMKIPDIDINLRPEQIQELASKMPRDQIQVFETSHRTKDGRQIPVEISSSLVSYGERTVILSIARDITERKKAEEAFRENYNRFQALVESMPQCVFSKDLEGRFIFANQRYCASMGKQLSDILGKTDFDLHPPELAQKYQADDLKVIQTGQVLEQVEIHQTLDGKKSWVQVVKAPLYDAYNRIKGVLGIFWDITEKKQMEEAIKRELEEKEVLLREVHHRIKNHLANVISILSLQANATSHPETKLELEKAISMVRGFHILYEKLLSKKGYQEISFKDYIEDLIDSIVLVQTMNANIKLDVQKNIVDFNIFSKKAIDIGIIITELLTNIFKYAFKDRTEGSVWISTEKSDKNITLTIKDNGIGINKTENNQSQGLGLKIVNILIRQLNGSFNLTSDSNGTTCVMNFEL